MAVFCFLSKIEIKYTCINRKGKLFSLNYCTCIQIGSSELILKLKKMEKQLIVKSEYDSLDKILGFIKSESSYQCSKDYDSWEVRTDTNGQMEMCVLMKKSAMHGMKIHFLKENTIKMTYIIPNKIMHAYFGKSQKKYRNILEIVTGKIKQLLLSSSQQKAFEEMEQIIHKISA